MDRLFEGDPAPTDCFEELVSIRSDNPIGSSGKKRLVPWLRSSNGKNYLVVLCDPRPKSPALRAAVASVLSSIPLKIKENFVVVNADSPAENRRWMKKSSIPDSLKVFSDEKLTWMRELTALGSDRWSMTVFVLAEGKVQKLAREVDQYGATNTIVNAVAAFKKETRL